MLVRQLEEEVVKTRAHAKETQPEIKHHIEGLQMENDHLTREVAILKETTKVYKMRSNNNVNLNDLYASLQFDRHKLYNMLSSSIVIYLKCEYLYF